MLVKLKGIEETMGSASHRNADGSYCDRLIDIDIMAVDELCIDETNLKIPHPHLQERTFFLEPLAELAPEWEHPLLHQTVKDLLKIVKNEE